MKSFVYAFEVRVGYVSIYLSSGDVAVAQHSLYAAQICAVHQQIGRKTMPERVWSDPFCYAGQ